MEWKESPCKVETSNGIRRLLDDLIRDVALSNVSALSKSTDEDDKVQNSQDKRFQCEECEYATVRRNALLGHTRTVHVRKKVLVDENSDYMIRKKTAITIVKNQEGGYDCGLCGNNFAKKARVRRHFANIHDENRMQYACEICGHTFNQKSNKIQHVRVVHEHKYDFECQACGKQFSTNYLMHAHAEGCDGKRKDKELQNITDPMIQEKTDFSPQLNPKKNIAPKKYHKRDLDCGACGKSFTKMVFMKRHNEEMHGGRYACEECGKSFASLTSKNRHVKIVHEHNKDFECDKCGKKFGYKQKMLLHAEVCQELRSTELQKFFQAVANILKVNGNVDIIPESQKVLKLEDVGDKVEIKKYVTLPSKKVFECGVCGKRFTQKADMAAHTATVHEERKDFQCKICGEKFGKVSTLQRHVCRVAQNVDYKCEICSKTLFSNQKLKLHVRICHGVKIATPENKLKKKRFEVVNLISPGRPAGITMRN